MRFDQPLLCCWVLNKICLHFQTKIRLSLRFCVFSLVCYFCFPVFLSQLPLLAVQNVQFISFMFVVYFDLAIDPNNWHDNKNNLDQDLKCSIEYQSAQLYVLSLEQQQPWQHEVAMSYNDITSECILDVIQISTILCCSSKVDRSVLDKDWEQHAIIKLCAYSKVDVTGSSQIWQ